MALTLFHAVLADITVWALCLWALFAFAGLSISHPATTYLAFHGVLISARALAILNGTKTLFSWRGASPVTEAEIARALSMADLALIAMTVGWIIAAHPPRSLKLALPHARRQLSVQVIHWVSGVAIFLGCAAILLWSKLPGVPPSEVPEVWAHSSWIVIAQTWAGLGLIALIYWHGFRLQLVIPLAAYLAVVMYQGQYRFRLLIPLILLLQIYCDRNHRRWPSWRGILLLTAGALILFPLKEIGQQMQSGEKLSAVWQNAQQQIGSALQGDHPDETILDQFASVLTLADRHSLYWGSTYAGLVTLAVPRQWWPEKPGLVDYEKDISTPARPMAETGMVVTMLGEFYLNFSYFGIIAMSFAVAFLTGSWFYSAYRSEYFTVARFAYLLVACNFIQVFRDGLISLFVFPVINMLPLTVIAAIHLLQSRPRSVDLMREPMLTTPRVRSSLHGRSTL